MSDRVRFQDSMPLHVASENSIIALERKVHWSLLEITLNGLLSWYLAFSIWHLAVGSWQLAVGSWHLVSSFSICFGIDIGVTIGMTLTCMLRGFGTDRALC